MESLEYLHSNEYVHADIKGSNLLTGFASADRHKVWLCHQLPFCSCGFTKTDITISDSLSTFARQLSIVLQLLWMNVIIVVLKLNQY